MRRWSWTRRCRISRPLTSSYGDENPLGFRGPRTGPSEPTTCGSPPTPWRTEPTRYRRSARDDTATGSAEPGGGMSLLQWGPPVALCRASGRGLSGSWPWPVKLLSADARVKRPGHHRVFSVNYFCRFRRLFLPVHLLFLTVLLGHSGAVAGDVEFQDDRVVDHSVDGRRRGHWVGEDVPHWEKTRLDVMPMDRRS